jgi:uncharacterized protein with HEPN domain
MKEQDRNAGIFLHDILDNISRVERFTKDITFEQFRSDEKTYFATIQCVEIIGEAAKHIPASVRSVYHEVPWNDMAGMRDKLIHAYFGTDPIRVWKVVIEDLPILKPSIENAVKSLKSGKKGKRSPKRADLG